ncbi:MAG: hypothetical protein JOZ38_03905, partial [Candidatus Eremiobacteraeota bacterium]|nr:hypothetical protein [Candidatus Eremiobacteraeota bacterium]
MARVRRKATAKTRLNYEIAGIAALGLAVLLGIALLLPARAGIAGASAANALHAIFGAAAWLFVLLVAFVGTIIFLEINVPRMIATLGTTALAFFLLIDAWLGRAGGAFGAGMWWSLSGLLGVAGARIVIALAAVALAVSVTNVSLKKVIGWCIVQLRRVRLPKVHLALPPGHAGIREAFDLRASEPAPLVPMPVDPVAVPAEIVITEAALAVDAPEPHAEEQFEEDEEFEEDDEYEDDGELDDDEIEDDEVEDDEPEDAAPPPVRGEYEPASAIARPYRLPDLALFDPPQAQVTDDSSRSHVLEDTLASFGVGAKVTHIERGPSITRYELKPERGIKISRISALADDIALALAATSVRIEAPIPGKSAVGIEVPNQTVAVVAIREILDSLPNRGQVPPLWMALGKDIMGRPVFGDLCKMPHILVAG